MVSSREFEQKAAASNASASESIRVTRYAPHTGADVGGILDADGVERLDNLFTDVHPRSDKGLDLPSALSEYEPLRDENEPVGKNVASLPIFLSATVYEKVIGGR